jgi:aspartate carbamoyltransferase regulatory subunit
LVAPFVKLNIIKDYKVIEKKEVAIQDHVIGIVKCFNPKCITNQEKITTQFQLVDRENMVLKCHYCEKVTMPQHFAIL